MFPIVRQIIFFVENTSQQNTLQYLIIYNSVAINGQSLTIADHLRILVGKKLGNYKNGRPLFTHTQKGF